MNKVTKKIISNLLIITMIFTCIFNSQIVGAVEYGDFDGNGYIDANDASGILDYVLNSDADEFKNYTNNQIKAAKVSGNTITAKDASEVLQKSLDSSFQFSLRNGKVPEDSKNDYEPDGFTYSGNAWLCGDSTVCYYDSGYQTEAYNYRQGWGMQLDKFLPENSKLTNLAVSGRSARDFSTTSAYASQYAQLKNGISAGDYLIVQFGHNDQKCNATFTGASEAKYETIYSVPISKIGNGNLDWYGDDDGFIDDGNGNSVACFEWFLYYNYIKVAKDKGAQPVLCTPITRTTKEGAGASIEAKHELYAQAIRDLGVRMNVPVVDLLKETTAYWNEVYAQSGVEGITALHAASSGALDRTHLSSKGAEIVAKMVAEGLYDLNLDIAAGLRGIEKEETTTEADTETTTEAQTEVTTESDAEAAKPALDFYSVTVDANEQTNASSRIFATVGEALSYIEGYKAPKSEAERITINIKPGTYREQIFVNTPYITFANADSNDYNDVILTWYYGIGYKYYSVGSDGFYNKEAYEANKANNTYTRAVTNWGHTVRVNSAATGFKAENITFENSFNYYVTQEEIDDGITPAPPQDSIFYSDGKTAKPDRASLGVGNAVVKTKDYIERACALFLIADKTYLENCYIKSAQDTLGTNSNREYFKNCVIEGVTDYICGSGSCVFDECELKWHDVGAERNSGYITAPKTNYLFRNCKVTGAGGTKGMYYGRPWGGASAHCMMFKTKLEYSTKNPSSLTIHDPAWTSMSSNSASCAKFYEYGTVKPDGTTLSLANRTKNDSGFGTALTNAWDVLQFNAYNYTKGMDGWDPTGVGAKVLPIQNELSRVDFTAGNENVKLEDGVYKILGDFTAPSVGSYETKLSSSSSNIQINGTAVTVTRPRFGEGAEEATITVYAREKDSDEYGDMVTFDVLILPETPENAEEGLKLVSQYVQSDFKAAHSDKNGNIVINDSLVFEATNDKYSGYKFNWSSSDVSVISNEGKVTRPAFAEDAESKTVTLTCEISDSEGNKNSFSEAVTVEPMPFGIWETFETAELNAVDTNAILWTDGDESNQEVIEKGIVNKIGTALQKNGSFYKYVIGNTAPSGTSANKITFFLSGDKTAVDTVTTTGNVSEMTFKIWAPATTGKTEFYFMTPEDKNPFCPQYNTGKFTLPSTAGQYEDGVAPTTVTAATGLDSKWYTVKAVMNTTEGSTKFTADLYVYDENGKLLGKSLNIPKFAKNDTTQPLTNINRMEIRPDRSSADMELYFDDFGYIDYAEAVSKDLIYIGKKIETAQSFDTLQTEGPRGTSISYKGSLTDGTVKVSKGYYGGEATIGYSVIYTIKDGKLGEETNKEFVEKTDSGAADFANTDDYSDWNIEYNMSQYINKANTQDVGGNVSAKVELQNKAVFKAFDTAVNNGVLDFEADIYIDKTTAASAGRYFRIYFENAQTPNENGLGTESFASTNIFYHLMDVGDTAYIVTTDEPGAKTATSSSIGALDGGKWYRVKIALDLDNATATTAIYLHGTDGSYAPDSISASPIGAITEKLVSKTPLELKQIRLVRTAGGVVYFDNVSLKAR